MRAEKPSGNNLNASRVKNFPPAYRPDWLWGPLGLLEVALSPDEKRPVRESHHLPVTSAWTKRACIHNTFPISLHDLVLKWLSSGTNSPLNSQMWDYMQNTVILNTQFLYCSCDI